MITKTEIKKSVEEWDRFYKSFTKSANIDYFESDASKRKRIEELLNNPVEFNKYYFPRVCKSEAAPWQKKFYKYMDDNDVAFFVGKISRDLAKSAARAMNEVRLILKGEIKTGVLASHTKDQAEMLIKPVKMAL